MRLPAPFLARAPLTTLAAWLCLAAPCWAQAVSLAGLMGGKVFFTPHLAPMTRGILATCYARPSGATSTKQLLALLRGVYANEPFIVVTDQSPGTKSTYGTNVCQITAR